MKIIGEDIEEEKYILELISKSKPSSNSKFEFKKIEEYSGWAYLIAQTDEYEFSINYSSCMFDASILIEFFSELLKSKDDLVLFLDYEGRTGLKVNSFYKFVKSAKLQAV